MFLLIFGVFLFLLLCFCVVMLLSLAKPTKTETPKKTPPKKWKYFRVFFTRQVMVACAKVIVLFFGCFLVFFAGCSKNPIKIGFFEDFDMLIFSFFGQKSRVNNLAMVELITWPFFLPKFCPKKWPSY